MSEPMTDYARRSRLDALRAVLRRRNPGLDFAFSEIERDHGRGDPRTGKVSGGLAAPEDTNTVLDRVDVSTTPTGAANHDRVDEPTEDFAPLGGGEG